MVFKKIIYSVDEIQLEKTRSKEIKLGSKMPAYVIVYGSYLQDDQHSS